MLVEPPSKMFLYLHHPRRLIPGRIVAIVPGKHNRAIPSTPRPDGVISFSLPTAKPVPA